MRFLSSMVYCISKSASSIHSTLPESTEAYRWDLSSPFLWEWLSSLPYFTWGTSLISCAIPLHFAPAMNDLWACSIFLLLVRNTHLQLLPFACTLLICSYGKKHFSQQNLGRCVWTSGPYCAIVSLTLNSLVFFIQVVNCFFWPLNWTKICRCFLVIFLSKILSLICSIFPLSFTTTSAPVAISFAWCCFRHVTCTTLWGFSHRWQHLNFIRDIANFWRTFSSLGYCSLNFLAKSAPWLSANFLS